MLAEYKKKTNVGIGVGLLMQIGGNVLMGSGTDTIQDCCALARVSGLSRLAAAWSMISVAASC